MWGFVKIHKLLCTYISLFLVIISSFYSSLLHDKGLEHPLVQKLLYILTNKSHILHFKSLHASSVWCTSRIDGSKIFKFKNLYFLPQFRDHLVFLLNENSIISGVESVASLKTINLSSVKNNNNCNLKLVILKSKATNLNQYVKVVNKDVLIMKRFKPDNIMHVIHDDLLPLFVTYQDLCQGDIDFCVGKYQLAFIDNYLEGPYFEWYRIFSTDNPMIINNKLTPICLKKAIIGISQESVWFDYGFKNTQGPYNNSFFNSLYLKQFTLFMKVKFGIKLADNFPKPENSFSVVLLNRVINRKILNAGTIKIHLEKIYKNSNYQLYDMDLSINSSKKLISVLQNSNCLIGMHGSAMLLTLFMPEGSHIIELFPFGIQPDSVSPIKALCSLPNVYYKYHAWVNMNEKNTITHPEYPPLLGGISHLPLEEQQNIKNVKFIPPVRCCHNPEYLFRMFQDTIVDETFYSLLNVVLSHSNADFSDEENKEKVQLSLYNRWYFPPPIFNLTCHCSRGELNLGWSYPYKSSGITFNVYVSSGFSLTTNRTHVSNPMKECRRERTMMQTSLSVWVKVFEDVKESIDSYQQCNLSKQ